MTTPSDYQIADKFLNLRQSARDRGLEFNLSLASVRNILRARKCAFTGQPIGKKTRSVDRIDASKGYVKGNVVACHTNFNNRKASVTPEDVKIMYRLMKKRKML